MKRSAVALSLLLLSGCGFTPTVRVINPITQSDIQNGSVLLDPGKYFMPGIQKKFF